MSGESFRKSPFEPDPVSRMMRPTCSECDADGIEWMSPNELLQRVLEGEKQRVHEGIEFSTPGGDAWLCPACGAFGLFSPTDSL